MQELVERADGDEIRLDDFLIDESEDLEDRTLSCSTTPPAASKIDMSLQWHVGTDTSSFTPRSYRQLSFSWPEDFLDPLVTPFALDINCEGYSEVDQVLCTAMVSSDQSQTSVPQKEEGNQPSDLLALRDAEAKHHASRQVEVDNKPACPICGSKWSRWSDVR